MLVLLMFVEAKLRVFVTCFFNAATFPRVKL